MGYENSEVLGGSKQVRAGDTGIVWIASSPARCDQVHMCVFGRLTGLLTCSCCPGVETTRRKRASVANGLRCIRRTPKEFTSGRRTCRTLRGAGWRQNHRKGCLVVRRLVWTLSDVQQVCLPCTVDQVLKQDVGRTCSPSKRACRALHVVNANQGRRRRRNGLGSARDSSRRPYLRLGGRSRRRARLECVCSDVGRK